MAKVMSARSKRRRLICLPLLLIVVIIALSLRSRDDLPGLTDLSTGTTVGGPSKALGPCHIEQHVEYEGNIIRAGSENPQNSEVECCQSCASEPLCNVWSYCSTSSCGGELHRSCLLKHHDRLHLRQPTGYRTPDMNWTSGAVFSDAAGADFDLKEMTDAARLAELRENPLLPLVFLDVEVKGVPLGRMEFVLFSDISPRSAENFRQLCTGEAGVVPVGNGTEREGAGKPRHFKGAYFYRIIYGFIDQAGVDVESAFGGEFKDDQGGLDLKHDRKGLLSMANHGPHTNSAHFSLMQGAAIHNDDRYTVFGELVTGWEIAAAINLISRGKPEDTAGKEEEVVIVDSGQIRKGTTIPDLERP